MSSLDAEARRAMEILGKLFSATAPAPEQPAPISQTSPITPS